MKKQANWKKKKGNCLLGALIMLSFLGGGIPYTVEAAATYTWKGNISENSLDRDGAPNGGTLPSNPSWRNNTLTFENTDVTLWSYSRSIRTTPTINVRNGNLTIVATGSTNNPVYLRNTGTLFHVENGAFTFTTSTSATNYLAQKIAVNDGDGRGSLFEIKANKIDVRDVVLRGAEGNFIATKSDTDSNLDGSIHMAMIAHRGWLLTDLNGNLINPQGKTIRYDGDPTGDLPMKANGLDTVIMNVQAEGNVYIESLQVQKIGKVDDGADGRWLDTDAYYSLVPIRSYVEGKSVILSGIDVPQETAVDKYTDNSGNFAANAMDIGNAHIKATGGNIDIASRDNPTLLGKNNGIAYFMTKNGGIFLEAKEDETETEGSTGNVYLLDGFVTDRPIKWELDDNIASAFDLQNQNKADLFVIADNDIVQDTYDPSSDAVNAYNRNKSLLVNQGTTVMAGRSMDLKGELDNAGTVTVKAKEKDGEGGSIHVNEYRTVDHTIFSAYKDPKKLAKGPWNIEASKGVGQEGEKLDVIYGVTNEDILRRLSKGTVYALYKDGAEELPTTGEFIGDDEVTLDYAVLGNVDNTTTPVEHTLHVESKNKNANVEMIEMYNGSKATIIGQDGTGLSRSGSLKGEGTKLTISLQNDPESEGHTVAGNIVLGKYQNPSDYAPHNGIVNATDKAIIEADAGTEEGNDLVGGEIWAQNGGLIIGKAEHGSITTNTLNVNAGTIRLKAKDKIIADIGGTLQGHSVFTWDEITNNNFEWDTAGLIELESTEAKLAEMKGDITTDGGLIRAIDTNLHVGNLRGNGTTIDIRRMDYEENEENPNYQPEGDEALGRYVVADSVAGSANTFLMTISSTAKNSDFLYIKEGSSAPQTVFIKNLEGIVNEMKSDKVQEAPDGTKRVPFAMVFHNDGKTFNVKGKPESWQGKLVRSVVRIDKLNSQQEEMEKWKSDYHKVENGKLNWNDFVNEETSPASSNRALTSEEEAPNYHLGDAANANIYYIVLDTEDNKPLTDAIRHVSDNLWTIATDMDPDVDQMNGSFFGAKYFDEGKPLYEGLWARYSQDKYRPGYDNMISHTMEFGYDHAWRGKSGNRRVGMSFQHIQGSGDGVSKTTFDGMAKHHGTYRLSAIRYYDMWFGDKGHYRNLMAKAGQGLGKYTLTNDFDSFSGEFHGSFYSLGGEYGYKKDLGNHVYFIPQIQVQYTRFGDDDFTTSDGLQFHNEGGNSFRTRLGFKLGREVEYDKENKDQWFLRVNWHREWMGDTGLSGVDTEGNFRSYDWERKGSWYEVGLGVNAHITKNLSGYLDFSRHYGKAAQKRYDINVGIQIRS